MCECVNIGVLFRVKSLILARRGEGEGEIDGEKSKKKEGELGWGREGVRREGRGEREWEGEGCSLL